MIPFSVLIAEMLWLGNTGSWICVALCSGRNAGTAATARQNRTISKHHQSETTTPEKSDRANTTSDAAWGWGKSGTAAAVGRLFDCCAALLTIDVTILGYLPSPPLSSRGPPGLFVEKPGQPLDGTGRRRAACMNSAPPSASTLPRARHLIWCRVSSPGRHAHPWPSGQEHLRTQLPPSPWCSR